jgi:hypothetical protein
MLPAALCSLVLHGSVLLLLLLLGRQNESPALAPPPFFPVDLLTIAAVPTPPTGFSESAVPAQKPAAAAAPATIPPPSPSSPPPPKAPVAAPSPGRPMGNQPSRTPPESAFAAMLRGLAPLNDAAGLRNGRPAPGPTRQGIAPDGRAALGRRGASGLADYIRVQIERHWEFGPTALSGVPIVVTLRLHLDPDGTVSGVDIVDDPRYHATPGYLDVAASARRAALVASPLQIPAGLPPDVYADLTLTFSPRDSTR